MQELWVVAGLVFDGLAETAPDTSLDPVELAHVGRAVENEVFGLPSGILDQLASAGSVEGHASLIDCRSLTLRPVPVAAEVTKIFE